MAQAKHQACRLDAPALVTLLQFDAGSGRQVRIGRCIDRHRGLELAQSTHGRDPRSPHRPAVVAQRVEKISVQQQPHAALRHHLEEQRLVQLRVERRDRRNVVRRVVHVSGRPAHRHKTLDDLLRDPADDPLPPRMKRHPRPDHRRGCRPAEKPVALDQQRVRPVPRRSERRRAPRVAAADNEHVVRRFHVRVQMSTFIMSSKMETLFGLKFLRSLL